MKKDNLIFINLIIPYACILMVPILIWVFSNIFVINMNEKKVVSIMMNAITNNVSIIDRDLSQIEKMVYSMSQNQLFNNFFNCSELTYKEMVDLKDTLLSYNLENMLIKDMYIYSRTSDVLVDLLSPYKNSRDFFQTKLSFIQRDMDAYQKELREGTWKEGYGKSEHCTLGQSTEEIIPYTRTVPVTYPKKKLGNITILIDKKQFLSLFSNLITNNMGEVHVFQNNNEILTSSGMKYSDVNNISHNEQNFSYKKCKINGEKLYRFSFVSSQNKWRYEVYMPQNVVLKETHFVNIILTIINVFSFLLGCVMCVYFTYGRNKSYINIMNMLGIKSMKYQWFSIKDNEFAFWQPYIDNLVNENKKIKENLDKITDAEKDRILHMLFINSFRNETEARECLERSDLKLNGSCYTVLTIRTDMAYSADVGLVNFKVFFAHVIDSFIEDKVYIYLADAKHIAVLFSFDEEEEDFCYRIKQQLTKIYLEIIHRYHIPILFGMGNSTSELCAIAASFEQSKEVIEYNYLVSSKEILFYKDLPKNNTMYYYPEDVENKLISYTVQGDLKSVKSLVSMVYKENFVKRTLTKEKISELIKEIYYSLNKIKSKYLSNEEKIDYRVDTFSVKNFFEYVVDFLSAVSDNLNSKKLGQRVMSFDEILNYINENYMNPDLSLMLMSEHFEIQDITYMSKLIKRLMKENFSTCLEKFRIEKSCELLIKGENSIKDIAAMVGYISDATYRRAFKRQKGINPTDYMEMLRIANETVKNDKLNEKTGS